MVSDGHSSMPRPDNAAVRIARAVDRIASNQMPTRVEGLAGQLLDAVAPYSATPMRVAFANRWLTGPLITRQFLASPDTAAMLRTTTAPTILQAGSKDNVLPQSARAVINHRILPGDTMADVLAHDRNLAADAGATARALPGGHDPSRPADPKGEDYRRLATVIRAVFPQAPIAPGLVLGAPDGRAYEGLARSVLRFNPIVMRKDDLSRFHGNDERVSIANHMRAIGFYERLIGG